MKDKNQPPDENQGFIPDENLGGLKRPGENDPPTTYINGFAVQSSLSDIRIVVGVDGIVVTTINMSFTTAKTLAEHLTLAISTLERESKHEIMKMSQVESALKVIAKEETK